MKESVFQRNGLAKKLRIVENHFKRFQNKISLTFYFNQTQKHINKKKRKNTAMCYIPLLREILLKCSTGNNPQINKAAMMSNWRQEKKRQINYLQCFPEKEENQSPAPNN